MRTYTELMALPSFIERFRYLKLNGRIGEETFGFDRWLNQVFYRSPEWMDMRQEILVRDNGCDLAHPDHIIGVRPIIHHMNPIKPEDLVNVPDEILNPEFLVCVSKRTHDAIHFGDASLLPSLPTERTPNDMCPWK